MIELASRLAGPGQLALIGGGEFSFGETTLADALWTGAAMAGGVGFLPTASGSSDYGEHFAAYLSEGCDREVATIPIYRKRDARRQKNVERIGDAAAVYIGGGIGDQLLETLADSPALEAIEQKIVSGGSVVAVAAAAQTVGVWIRSLDGRSMLPGFGWLDGVVVEANFLPTHDHRLRKLLAQPGARIGIGLPAGSCLLLSGQAEPQIAGSIFLLEGPDEDLKMLKHDQTADDVG